MAGLPLESLPGPQIYPYDLPVEERATRALAMLRAGYLGEKNGGAARDPESMALLFDSVRRAVDPRTAPDVPMTLQWEFPDAEPWHLRLDNGSTAAVPGRAPDPFLQYLANQRRRQACPFQLHRRSRASSFCRTYAGPFSGTAATIFDWLNRTVTFRLLPRVVGTDVGRSFSQPSPQVKFLVGLRSTLVGLA